MKYLPSIPDIEPLSAATWTNIETGVFDQLDRQPTTSLHALETPSAQADSLPSNRSPRRVRAGRIALAAAALAAVALLAVSLWPDQTGAPETSTALTRIETMDAPAELTVARSIIRLAPESVAWYGDDPSGVRVLLERGAVDCAVARQPAGQTFVVHANDVRVEVVGTKFSVANRERSVSVAVTQGVVDVYHRGESTTLQAGQSWPLAVVENKPEPPTQPPVADTRPTTGRKMAPKRAKPSPRDMWKRAQRLEDSDPEAAMVLYRKLAKGKGRWAANGLYSLCEMHAGRGEKSAARQCLDRYLDRFQSGENRQDARWLLQRL